MHPKHSHRSMGSWAADLLKDMSGCAGCSRDLAGGMKTEWSETDARLPSITEYKFITR